MIKWVILTILPSAILVYLVAIICSSVPAAQEHIAALFFNPDLRRFSLPEAGTEAMLLLILSLISVGSGAVALVVILQRKCRATFAIGGAEIRNDSPIRGPKQKKFRSMVLSDATEQRLLMLEISRGAKSFEQAAEWAAERLTRDRK